MLIPGNEIWWLIAGFILMAIPAVEFRSLDITETEPANRTTAGSSVGQDVPLDFGTVNNTAGIAQAGPVCLIFRCTNLQGNALLSNLRFWLSNNASFSGVNRFFCAVTDTWTQNKTVSEVAAGTPGIIPESVPAANVARIGGGDIAGTGHADTSQYIYLALEIGQNELIGLKGGADGGFAYSMKFDYS